MSNAAAAAAATTTKPDAKGVDAKSADVKKLETEARAPIAALLASEIKARESGVYFNTWEVVPRAGTPIEDLERPEFWGNVSQNMRQGDTLLVLPRDGQWYAELLVWDAGQNWAHVSLKGVTERPAFEQIAGVASDFVIGRDPIDGIVIKRASTGAKVKGNFPSHEDARKWILDHQRALRN
jgi:hypothetical protein